MFLSETFGKPGPGIEDLIILLYTVYGEQRAPLNANRLAQSIYFAEIDGA